MRSLLLALTVVWTATTVLAAQAPAPPATAATGSRPTRYCAPSCSRCSRRISATARSRRSHARMHQGGSERTRRLDTERGVGRSQRPEAREDPRWRRLADRGRRGRGRRGRGREAGGVPCAAARTDRAAGEVRCPPLETPQRPASSSARTSHCSRIACSCAAARTRSTAPSCAATRPPTELELWPIDDEANVDARRKAAGLEPLADYVRRFGLTYKPGGA